MDNKDLEELIKKMEKATGGKIMDMEDFAKANYHRGFRLGLFVATATMVIVFAISRSS